MIKESYASDSERIERNTPKPRKPSILSPSGQGVGEYNKVASPAIMAITCICIIMHFSVLLDVLIQ